MVSRVHTYVSTGADEAQAAPNPRCLAGERAHDEPFHDRAVDVQASAAATAEPRSLVTVNIGRMPITSSSVPTLPCTP